MTFAGYSAAVLICIFVIRIFTLFIASADMEGEELDRCTDFSDVFDGCSGTLQTIATLGLGIIPGLPPVISITIAVITTVLIVTLILSFVRGSD